MGTSSAWAAVATVAGAADCASTRERLWGSPADADEYAAATTVFAALDTGLDPQAALLEVIAPCSTGWAPNGRPTR